MMSLVFLVRAFVANLGPPARQFLSPSRVETKPESTEGHRWTA